MESVSVYYRFLSFDKADTPEAMKKSGYAFGNFQYLLSDFPAEKLHETIPDFHNTVDRYAKFEQAVQKDVMGRVKEVEAEISFIKEREKDCHYFEICWQQGRFRCGLPIMIPN